MCALIHATESVQEAMEHLETPAFLVFLHQVSALVILWGLSSQANSGLNLAGISSRDMVASIPAAVLDSLHLILLFSALNHGAALAVVALTQVMTTLLGSVITLQGIQFRASLNSTQLVRRLTDQCMLCCCTLRAVRLNLTGHCSCSSA